MNRIRFWLMGAVLAAALLLPGCWPFRRAKAPIPPPPKPVPMVPVGPPETEASRTKIEPVWIPMPPELEPPKPDFSKAPPLQMVKLPPWRGRRGSRDRARTVAPPAPVPTPPNAEDNPAPAPVPQLEQILTPEQQQTYNEEIDRNINRAQTSVAALIGRRLNQEQQTYLDRIRTFIQQATDARKTDLVRAKNLAERASVLADDLLRSVQ